MLLQQRSITLSMGLNQLLAVGICAGLLVAAGPAASEMYRWTDDKGQLYFTSDKSKDPAPVSESGQREVDVEQDDRDTYRELGRRAGRRVRAAPTDSAAP